jgi:hypothetical protein
LVYDSEGELGAAVNGEAETICSVTGIVWSNAGGSDR